MHRVPAYLSHRQSSPCTTVASQSWKNNDLTELAVETTLSPSLLTTRLPARADAHACVKKNWQHLEWNALCISNTVTIWSERATLIRLVKCVFTYAGPTPDHATEIFTAKSATSNPFLLTPSTARLPI